LKNLKEKSIEQPILDDFGIISGANVGGFRSSKTLMEVHHTTSSDHSS